MPEIDIQRQNYIADIRASIADCDTELKSVQADIKQIDELLEYCKVNKLRKFRRKVVKLEKYIARNREKELNIRRKALVGLLSNAEKYAPGKGWHK